EGPAEHGLVRLVGAIARRPEQVFFFVPLVLLTILLALETSKGSITIAWGFEAVAVVVLGFLLKERVYALSALGFIVLCLGKLILIDLWQLSSGQKYLTMGALGVTAVLFSFLFPRYKHRLRELL